MRLIMDELYLLHFYLFESIMSYLFFFTFVLSDIEYFNAFLLSSGEIKPCWKIYIYILHSRNCIKALPH